ncbi:LysR family transcriptional regulator [Paenibacillus sp. NPDC058071]|uniref:LysR family transcriptional regulator n=1 Tax=Paenibacillus sp. NPDC058071 TaxID=3346326 RepID=UPI0036DC569D
MNIEQLAYIVEVAHTQSLAEAAKTLNVSQSALSQAISRLEVELQVKLFNRNRTGARTTREGDIIVEKARLALQAIQGIKDEAYNLLHHTKDLLQISMIPGLTGPLMETYLGFKRSQSSLKIEVTEQGSKEIIDSVRNEVLDTGFIAIHKRNIGLIDGLHFTPVLEGRLMVFAPKELMLLDKEQRLSIDILKEQLFVLYKDEHVQAFMTDFQRLHGSVEIFFQTTNMQAISHSIMELNAVTIGHDVSALFDANYDANKLQAVPIDFVDAGFRFGWVRLSGCKLSQEAERFILELSALLKQQSARYSAT